MPRDNADGNDVNVADREIAEDGGTVSVIVENPTGTESDITVNYTISGDAVWGVDYTIEGADESGGSMTIFAADYTDRVLEGNGAMTFKIFNT